LECDWGTFFSDFFGVEESQAEGRSVWGGAREASCKKKGKRVRVGG